MLDIAYPEIAARVATVARGLFAFEGDEKPVLVVKASSREISAARTKLRIKFYAAPVWCDGLSTYCLLSAYLDDEVNPMYIITPLYQDAATSRLLEALSTEFIEVFLIDEKSRPWAAFQGANVDHRKFASFARKMTLPNAQLARNTVDSVSDQAEGWFGNTTDRDDRRAFNLVLGELIGPDGIVIHDLREHAYSYHGAPMRHTTLHYREPGPRQEPDLAEQFTRIFDGSRVFLNPLRPKNKEEVCDILLVGRMANYFVQLKSSPNTEEVQARTIERNRAKVLQHLNRALTQTEECAAYIEGKESFEVCLRSDHKIVSTIRQAQQNAIFIIVTHEVFSVDRPAYGRTVKALAEKIKKPVNYLSESLLYDYLHYCRGEEDFFKLNLSDFAYLVARDELKPRMSVVPRLLELEAVPLTTMLRQRPEDGAA